MKKTGFVLLFICTIFFITMRPSVSFAQMSIEVSPMLFRSEIDNQKIIKLAFISHSKEEKHRVLISYADNFCEDPEIEWRRESSFAYQYPLEKLHAGSYFKLALENKAIGNPFFTELDYLIGASIGIDTACLSFSGGLGYSNAHISIEGYAYEDYINSQDIVYPSPDSPSPEWRAFLDYSLNTYYQARMMKWQKGKKFYDEGIPVLLSGALRESYGSIDVKLSLDYIGETDNLHHYTIDYGISAETPLSNRLSLTAEYKNHDNEDYGFAGDIDDYHLISCGLKYSL
jgi:hypothetical protein